MGLNWLVSITFWHMNKIFEIINIMNDTFGPFLWVSESIVILPYFFLPSSPCFISHRCLKSQEFSILLFFQFDSVKLDGFHSIERWKLVKISIFFFLGLQIQNIPILDYQEYFFFIIIKHPFQFRERYNSIRHGTCNCYVSPSISIPVFFFYLGRKPEKKKKMTTTTWQQ